jgi:hypothetical protein
MQANEFQDDSKDDGARYFIDGFTKETISDTDQQFPFYYVMVVLLWTKR